MRPADQRHSGGEKSPGDHDASDPAASAHFFQQKITGYFTDKIRDEEKPAAEAENGGRQMQITEHLERGEAEIYAIDEGDEVAKRQERNDAQGDAPNRAGFNGALSA